ncbi:Probable 1-acylglycerol-3-phosphate O-acyltransferase [Mycobacteroides abscessus subsp. abscessus]|nr:Probable 1-acylglycerol-3-phosphate O-acyltransferase [Mycobacteroides abscessus subsp. abscessus]
MFYWLLKYIFMGPILQLMGRPKVEGLENIPSSGPAILAGNHLAVVDSFFLDRPGHVEPRPGGR